MLPNGDRIQSSHEADLVFPNLPTGAIRAHLFPDLKGQALLSIGVFCDSGCTANFTATTVQILHQGKTVLEGARTPPGLWTTSLTKPAWQANGAHTINLKINAIKYLHAACFSPTTQTWTKAIDQGFFRSIPALNSRDVHRHLPKSKATTMGHLDQVRQNIRSTKKSRPNDKEVLEFDLDLNPEEDTTTTNTAFASVIELDDPTDGKSYSDLTGRFPAKSEAGNLYVLVLYTYDNNAILVEPLHKTTHTRNKRIRAQNALDG
jgi:hypothetical protein